MAEQLIGSVSHYWGKIGVAGVELTGELKLGDTLRFVGATSDFLQTIESIQIEHEQVESAAAGDSVGVRVDEKVREHDRVFVVD